MAFSPPAPAPCQTLHGGPPPGTPGSPYPGLNKESCIVNCASCKETVYTLVYKEAEPATLLCSFLWLVFCCLPFSMLPFMTDDWRRLDHYCTNCGAYVGSVVPGIK